MEFAPIIEVRPSIFVRINFVIGLLLYSLSPLFWRSLPFNESVGRIDFGTAVVCIVALQGWLLFTHQRCGTPERSYWRSLLAIAACMSTGWTLLDMVLVPAALYVAMSVSGALACTRHAPVLMSRLVYWFYDHRMHQ